MLKRSTGGGRSVWCDSITPTHKPLLQQHTHTCCCSSVVAHKGDTLLLPLWQDRDHAVGVTQTLPHTHCTATHTHVLKRSTRGAKSVWCDSITPTHKPLLQQHTHTCCCSSVVAHKGDTLLLPLSKGDQTPKRTHTHTADWCKEGENVSVIRGGW